MSVRDTGMIARKSYFQAATGVTNTEHLHLVRNWQVWHRRSQLTTGPTISASVQLSRCPNNQWLRLVRVQLQTILQVSEPGVDRRRKYWQPGGCFVRASDERELHIAAHIGGTVPNVVMWYELITCPGIVTSPPNRFTVHRPDVLRQGRIQKKNLGLASKDQVRILIFSMFRNCVSQFKVRISFF